MKKVCSDGDQDESSFLSCPLFGFDGLPTGYLLCCCTVCTRLPFCSGLTSLIFSPGLYKLTHFRPVFHPQLGLKTSSAAVRPVPIERFVGTSCSLKESQLEQQVRSKVCLISCHPANHHANVLYPPRNQSDSLEPDLCVSPACSIFLQVKFLSNLFLWPHWVSRAASNHVRLSFCLLDLRRVSWSSRNQSETCPPTTHLFTCTSHTLVIRASLVQLLLPTLIQSEK